MSVVGPVAELVELSLAAAILAALAYAVLRLCLRHPVEAGLAFFLATAGAFALVSLDAARRSAGL